MATLGDINAKITALTNASTTEYASSDRLIDINMWNQKIVSMILDSQDESYYDDARFTGYPKVTYPLTANRDYSIGQTLTDTSGLTYQALKIKSLSVSYDGVNTYRATPMDLTEYDIGDAPASATTANATIDANFSKAAPSYSYKNGAIWLYPMGSTQDVANNGFLIAEFERSAADFTSGDLSTGTVLPGFDTTFHMMLAYGPASEWCIAKSLPQMSEVQEGLADFEARLRRQYSSKQQDRHLTMQMDYQSMK